MFQKIELGWNKNVMPLEEFLERVKRTNLPWESLSVAGEVAITAEDYKPNVLVYDFRD